MITRKTPKNWRPTMSKVSRWHVGIDLHRNSMQVQVLDGKGKPVQAHSVKLMGPADRSRALEMLAQWRRGGRYAVEAMGLNRWLVNGMQEAGMEVVVANPTRLGLKDQGKKTDRRDAMEIARRLWLGDIEAHALTYYPDDERYGRRKLLRARKNLVGIRTRCGNQIRSLLNAYGISAPAGALYRRPLQRWLRDLRLPTEEMEGVVQSLAAVLEVTQSQIRRLDGRIEELASTGVAAQLQTTRQVGALTALTIAEEMGEMDRFRSTRASAGYAGLVPRVDQSAERTRTGRLTRRGNPELRHILGQMAIRLLSTDRMVGRWAAPRLKRMSKNKVRTALARRLLIGLVASQRNGEPFELRRCLNL